jgi:hypothetical protein
MAFNSQVGSSSQAAYQAASSCYASSSPSQPQPQPGDPEFKVLDWYPDFQNCLRFFLDHAQHEGPVQAVAAFINIQLPFQKYPNPVTSSNASSPRGAGHGQDALHLRQHNVFPMNQQQTQSVSLLPYIRRLIVTGHDSPGILHGFFGDKWLAGIGQLHEIERRNYMFAAKSTNWLKVKQAYDMGPDETVPFLSPLRETGEKEIQRAESTWSEWLAMQGG